MTQLKQIGRYEIKGEVGRGGMASVFLAHDPHFKRDVAVKILPRQYTHDPMFRTRFNREAQTIAALEHPAIVPVYDFGEEDDQPFLVMRYMTGGSLADRITKEPIPIPTAIRIVRRISSALDEAHRNGIIHRDLKPGNILFDHLNNAFLADFGIVKLAESTISFTGNSLIGTPAYMSPEQAKGTEELDGRSDIYTLGIILFEMLTGRLPYQANTPIGLALKHISEPVPSIHEFSPHIPPEFEMIMRRALAKEREHRFASGAEFAAALQTASSGGQIPARPSAHKSSSPRQKTEVLINENGIRSSAFRKTIGTIPLWMVVGSLLVVILGFSLWFNYSRPFDIPDPSANSAIVDVATETSTSPALMATDTRQLTEVVVNNTLTSTPTIQVVPTPTIAPTMTMTPTDEPTQIATPANEPSVEVRIINSSINVRNGPGINYAVITVLFAGDIVRVLAKTSNGSWYNIELEDESRGWISATVAEPVDLDLIENVEVAATIPVLQVTNTPQTVPTSTPDSVNPTSPPSGSEPTSPPAPQPTTPSQPTDPPPTDPPPTDPPPPTREPTPLPP